MVLLLSMAFVSCKKERTCTCTTTNTNTSNGKVTTDPPSTSEVKYDKIRKSKLGTTCGDSKYSSSSTQTYGGTAYTNSSTSETTCEIK